MCRKHRSNSLPRWIHQVWHPSSGNSRSSTSTRASAAGLAIRRACVNCSTGSARHCVGFRDRFRRAKSSRPPQPYIHQHEQLMLKFRAAKKLIVAGCLVERFRAQILEQVPEVDAVVGTGEIERIKEAVKGDLRVLPAQPPAFLYHHLTPRIVTTPKHAAYIKIAEGCDHPCTFCIIPQLRGAFRSRRFELVLREAENLAMAGAREITLIGQDTTSYGEDLGLRDGLAQLLGKLAQTDGLLWVRFLYAYPNRVTQKLLETIAEHPRLAKYMDMPLQHASRDVLARMKRGSNGNAFLKLLERIRTTI